MRYDLLARDCAARIKLHLDLPVTVVTDKEIPGLNCRIVEPPKPNPRFYPDYNYALSFLNGARVNAYDLSPYDETLVIDTDYVVQSPSLLHWMKTPGLKLTRLAVNLDGTPFPEEMSTLGPNGPAMYWATVFTFDRSAESQAFFLYWKAAIENWDYYCDYFRLPGKLVRNDFAVTIALHKMFDAVGIPYRIDFPFSLLTLPHQWEVTSVDPDIEAVNPHAPIGDNNRLSLFGDTHVMNKKSLIERLANV